MRFIRRLIKKHYVKKARQHRNQALNWLKNNSTEIHSKNALFKSLTKDIVQRVSRGEKVVVCVKGMPHKIFKNTKNKIQIRRLK